MSKPLSHPADGLYYLDLPRLVVNDACEGHRDIWFKLNGHGKTPVTLENMTQHILRARRTPSAWASSSVLWLLYRMRNKLLLRPDEFRRVIGNFPTTAEPQARRLMDALALRAKREGRLK